MMTHEQFSEELIAYALGDLEASDAAAMDAHLDSCADCRRELDDLNRDLSILALSVPAADAPGRSRDRLLRAVRQEPKSRSVLWHRPWWMLAPVVASAVLAFFAILLWRENQQLRRQAERLREEISRQAPEADHARDIAAILTSSEAIHFTLVSDKNKPQPQVKVLCQPKKGQILLLASNLQAPPADKVYELWMLPAGGGSPIPAGIFRTGAQGNAILMESPASVEGVTPENFAVTLEPQGGSTTPTMPLVMSRE